MSYLLFVFQYNTLLKNLNSISLISDVIHGDRFFKMPQALFFCPEVIGSAAMKFQRPYIEPWGELVPCHKEIKFPRCQHA